MPSTFRILAILSLALAPPSLSRAAEATAVQRVVAGSPASAVVRLNNGSGSYCSGVLIGDDMAVTAAHCLYNSRTKRWIAMSSIHLLLGYDRGDYAFHTRATKAVRGNLDFDDRSATSSGDWALLRLQDKAPAQFARLSQARQNPPTGQPFRMFGFASPKKYLLQQVGGCMIAGEQDGFLLSRCSAAPGMSGGPLIDETTGDLLGIQIGMVGSGNERTLLAIPVSAWKKAAENF